MGAGICIPCGDAVPCKIMVNELISQVSEEKAEPQGAYFVFLCVSAVAYVFMLLFVFLYGRHGEQLTAGIDRACAEAAYMNGKKQEAVGNYELAIQRFHQALEGVFNDPERRYECQRSLGETLTRLDRYQEALELYKSMPPQALSKPGHLAGYANALWRAGELEEAERLSKRWLESAEVGGNVQQQVWANSMLGSLCKEMGRLAEAGDYFGKASALDSQSPAGIYFAQVLEQQGKLDEAIAQLDTFIQRVQSGPVYQDAVRLRGRFEEQRKVVRSPQAS